jgi:hypothetical protein
MSGSSDSSGGKTISSAEVEDLKKIVRELSQLGQLRAGDHETTPTGGRRGLRDLSVGATILPSVGRAGSGVKTENYRSALPVQPRQLQYEGGAQAVSGKSKQKVGRGPTMETSLGAPSPVHRISDQRMNSKWGSPSSQTQQPEETKSGRLPEWSGR